jgi:hypothetical protein
MQGWQPPPNYGSPPQGAYGVPPTPSGYGTPVPIVQQRSYEFNPQENAILARAAGRIKMWGVVSIVLGSLALLCGLPLLINPIVGLGLLVMGGVGLAVGIVFVKAAASIQTAVQTHGYDIPHLLSAIDRLGGAFLTQTIAVLIWVLINIVLGVLFFLFFAAVALSR